MRLGKQKELLPAHDTPYQGFHLAPTAPDSCFLLAFVWLRGKGAGPLAGIRRKEGVMMHLDSPPNLWQLSFPCQYLSEQMMQAYPQIWSMSPQASYLPCRYVEPCYF